MRSQLHRLLVSTGLAAATLIGTAASAQAQVRDHRHNPPEADAAPREAPPSPRDDHHEPHREGMVWITGRWDWARREHKWNWVPGHWERERRGKHWREARWEQRDGVFVLVEGDWIDAPVSRFPTAAPPPPRVERPAGRPGMLWISGRWDWRDGGWVWVTGHWERERAAQRWNEGRWELRGDHWEWIEGGWAEPPRFPPLDRPPPPPQREEIRLEPGQAWVPGHWRWENGQYLWSPGARARAQPGMHYKPGEWVQRDGHWIWTNGDWVRDEVAPPPPPSRPPPPPPSSGPSSPPPAPVDEHVQPREGYVWARGHHEWRGNQYEWIPGHWERQRARLTWYDGRWEQRGNVWIYVEGGWR
jgi:hypothetical protein